MGLEWKETAQIKWKLLITGLQVPIQMVRVANKTINTVIKVTQILEQVTELME